MPQSQSKTCTYRSLYHNDHIVRSSSKQRTKCVSPKSCFFSTDCTLTNADISPSTQPKMLLAPLYVALSTLPGRVLST